MRSLFFLTVLAVSSNVFAQQTETIARVMSSDVMFAAPVVDLNAKHKCQPLKGDTVAVLAVQKNADGLIGANMANVRVVSGLCAGTTGWIGVEQLQAVR